MPTNNQLQLYKTVPVGVGSVRLNCLFTLHSLGLLSIKQVVNVGEGSFLAKHHRAVTSSKPQTLLPEIYVSRSQATLFKPNHNPSK